MTPDDAIRALDDINFADAELAHVLADTVILATVPDEVRQAYKRLMDRCPWWAAA